MSTLYTVLSFRRTIKALGNVINEWCWSSDVNSHYANMKRCKDEAVRGFINGYVKLTVDKDQYLYDRREKYYKKGCEMLNVRFEVNENDQENFQIGLAYGARSGYETNDCMFTPPHRVGILKDFIRDSQCAHEDYMNEDDIRRWASIANERRTLSDLKFVCIYETWQTTRRIFQTCIQRGKPEAEEWGRKALTCAEMIEDAGDSEYAIITSLIDLVGYYINNMLLSNAEPLMVRASKLSDYDEFRVRYPELYESILYHTGLYNLKHEKHLDTDPHSNGADEHLECVSSVVPHKYNKIYVSLIEAYTKPSCYNDIPNFGYEVNQSLRTLDYDKLPDNFKQAIMDFDAAFIQTSNSSLELYRATPMGILDKFTNKGVLRYPAYMSSSRSIESAIKILNCISAGETPVLLKIVYPPNRPYIDATGVNNEQEVILPRNCEFSISDWFPSDDEELLMDVLLCPETAILKMLSVPNPPGTKMFAKSRMFLDSRMMKDS